MRHVLRILRARFLNKAELVGGPADGEVRTITWFEGRSVIPEYSTDTNGERWSYWLRADGRMHGRRMRRITPLDVLNAIFSDEEEAA